MDVSRRTSIALLGAGATGLIAAGPAAAQAVRAGIVLFDGRFEEARREAIGWSTRGGVAIDTSHHDIGEVWRTTIAERLAADRLAVSGITLYVDQMISATMARDHGLRLVHLRQDAAASGAASLFRWVLA
jgi:hypothetical protein